MVPVLHSGYFQIFIFFLLCSAHTVSSSNFEFRMLQLLPLTDRRMLGDRTIELIGTHSRLLGLNTRPVQKFKNFRYIRFHFFRSCWHAFEWPNANRARLWLEWDTRREKSSKCWFVCRKLGSLLEWRATFCTLCARTKWAKNSNEKNR